MRLPQDNNGRLKGFGYAEFADKEALLAALTLNNEVTFLAHETKFSGIFFLNNLVFLGLTGMLTVSSDFDLTFGVQDGMES